MNKKDYSQQMNEKSFKKFMIIWSGQFLSIIGSGLSAFGLSVWIFEKTGSATPFAMSFLFNILPRILFAPMAGSLADRKNRKVIIIFTDSVDAFLKILMALILLSNNMSIWMIYIFLFLSSLLSTFQGPAFSASIPMIVPKKNLSRANGLSQLTFAAQNMLSPIMAGALYPIVDLKGLLIIDFGTYFFAIFTILFQKIPQPEIKKATSRFLKTSLKDFAFAWNYIREKKGFLSLMMAFSVLNFIANLSLILLGPLILSNYNTAIYGLVQTFYGSAMVLGGLIASLLPNNNQKVKSMFLLLIISGIGLSISGMLPYWYIVALGFFIFMLPVPYTNTLLFSLVQTKIQPEVLGRVSSLIEAVLKLVTPLASILAGPLADNIFEPLMSENGALANSIIGNLIGVGTGRGIGLIFIICGISLVITCIFMLLNKNVNSIEKRLPDYIEE